VDNGRYLLDVPEVEGQRYSIVPKRMDDARNGVSTLDLVRIQKHLLGKELFDSPYQYIAADANNNEQISAIDLIEIRKLILGIYTSYPSNESWRFVDKNYQMANPQSPWPFDDVINIQYDGQSVYNQDFIAIKVGDVNNTAKANANHVLPRSQHPVITAMMDAPEVVHAGEIFDVVLTLPYRVAGFQWTLETKGLEFEQVSSEDIKINEQHIGQPGLGVVTMSWNDEYDAVYGKNGDLAIKMTFMAKNDGNPNDMITMSDKIARAEAYTSQDDILDVRLAGRTSGQDLEFALYQNEPNPWSSSTAISFDLPEAGKATVTLFDMTGKVIKVIEGDYKPGHHTIQLYKKDLSAQGVLYYRLDSGNYSAAKKMLRVE
jgi:hypothetical protein